MTAGAGRFPETQGIDAIAQRISECRTSYDVLRLTRNVATSYGFDYFAILRLPFGGERNLAALPDISNWPPEFVGAYDRLGLLDSSPAFQALREDARPEIWSVETIRQRDPEGRGAAAACLLSEFGMNTLTAFPTQSRSGGRGAVCFSGSRDTPSDSEVLELAYFSNLIYGKAAELRNASYSTEQPLSARERECLHWAANGKTSAETALILGLSEHTINHYLNAACNKLGATNRTHAVAKAIRSHILDWVDTPD